MDGSTPSTSTFFHFANSLFNCDIRITSDAFSSSDSEEGSTEMNPPPSQQDLLNCPDWRMNTPYGVVGCEPMVLGAAGVTGLVLILISFAMLYTRPGNPGLGIAMLFAGAILLTGAVNEFVNDMATTEVDITRLRWLNTE